jgi:hypothetical protein
MAVTPDTVAIADITAALEQDSAQDTLNLISQLLDGNTATPTIVRSNILAIMRTLDEMFYRIRPKGRLAPKSRPYLPAWLKELQGQYSMFGHYANDGDCLLIPRGPLLRIPREENAANAENLADRFAALAVVRLKHNHNGRVISIRHKIIDSSNAHGVASGSTTVGHEKVAFIPIAEDKDHLQATEIQRSEKKFVDFRIDARLNSAERLLAALVQAGRVDIVMAPEMVMSEAQANDLADKLQSHKGPRPRIIIAGSGATESTDEDGLPWNETRIFNGIGHELWRQRKIWTAGLTKTQADKLGLSDIGALKLMNEYNAEDNEIVIVDAGSLGRCVVLICQDLQAEPVSTIISQFQPDWVFTPILDKGIGAGGWVHQRTFSLSGDSQARFLVASSTALAQWLDPTKSVACGFAHGPKAPTATEDKGRLYALANVVEHSSPGYAIITWRSKDGWSSSTLT